MQIQEFLNQKFNVNLNNGVTQSNCTGLVQAAARCATHLNAHLYDAVVGLHENTKLDGRLNPAQLDLLRQIAKAGLQKTTTEEVKTQLKEFEFMCQRYMDFLSPKAPGTTDILNKKPANAAYPNAVPKHTLVSTGNLLIENLTWMTGDEVQRFNARYKEVHGIPAFSLEALKNLQRFGETETAGKSQLGKGSFGVVRLGRLVNTDEYVAVKKSHPIYVKPEVLKIQTGLNDGSQPGIIEIHGSLAAQSSRKEAISGEPPSTLTYAELGIVDLQDFLDQFRTLRYLFEGGIGKSQAALVQEMASINLGSNPGARASSSAALELVNLVRLTSTPFKDSALVRRFLNRMAYQMLEAVNQMHSKGLAHNDIKPNNFVLAEHNGKYRVKLIDFDMIADAKQGIGVPRDVYAKIYASPQVTSTEANNHPLLNDAYSAGMAIRQVNGEHALELALFRELVKGDLARELKIKPKPVEDRRRVEAQQIAMPELANLNQLADLLCHPKAGKRISVQEALRNPVFCQPDAMVSEKEFSELAAKAVRHGHLLTPEIMEKLYGFKEQEKQVAAQVSVSHVNRKVAGEIHKKEYENRLDQQAVSEAEKRVEKLVRESNLDAIPRRTGRLLNPLNLFKSADQKDAEYTFKSLSRR